MWQDKLWKRRKSLQLYPFNFLLYNSQVIPGNSDTFYSTITHEQILLQIYVHWHQV